MKEENIFLNLTLIRIQGLRQLSIQMEIRILTQRNMKIILSAAQTGTSLISSGASNLILRHDKSQNPGSVHPFWHCCIICARRANTLSYIREQTLMRIFSPADRLLAYDSQSYFLKQHLQLANLIQRHRCNFRMKQALQESTQYLPMAVTGPSPQAGLSHTCEQQGHFYSLLSQQLQERFVTFFSFLQQFVAERLKELSRGTGGNRQTEEMLFSMPNKVS